MRPYCTEKWPWNQKFAILTFNSYTGIPQFPQFGYPRFSIYRDFWFYPIFLPFSTKVQRVNLKCDVIRNVAPLNTRRWLVNALVTWHVSYKITTLLNNLDLRGFCFRGFYFESPHYQRKSRNACSIQRYRIFYAPLSWTFGLAYSPNEPGL